MGCGVNTSQALVSRFHLLPIGTMRWSARCRVQRKGKVMTDDFKLLPEEPGTAAKVADGIKTATGAVSDAIEAGREPGMPLDVVAKAVREAPLAALAIAFMVGVVFARPRR
jgi:hypothetical protein